LPDDHFGWSVAISGNTIVVGALGPFREPGRAVPAERVAYVFVKPRAGWSGVHTETARLTTTSPMPGGYFGNSVAVAGDTVVVGAPGRNVGAHVNQGEAFVFVKPRSGWSGTRTQTAVLISSDGAANDTFGWEVAASGNAVAVGGPQHRRGRLTPGEVYVFVKPRAGWAHSHTQTATLVAPHGLGPSVGRSLAMSGDTVVTGSNGSYADGGLSFVAFVYVRPAAAGWHGARDATATLKVQHRATAGTCGRTGESAAGYDFGSSLAISGDTIVGTTGAYGEDNHEYPGEVCVFTKPASGWSGTITRATTLIASDSRGPDLFGSGDGRAAAVSGGTVVVGAPNHRRRQAYGEAYVWAGPLSPPSATSPTSGARRARR
jgi:hypothetical protein